MNNQSSSERNRARELTERAHAHYNHWKAKLKKNQSINLVCQIGARQFDVCSLGDYANDFVGVHSVDSHGTGHFLIAPVEQTSFDTIIFNTPSKEPPREIGFHTIKAAQQR